MQDLPGNLRRTRLMIRLASVLVVVLCVATFSSCAQAPSATQVQASSASASLASQVVDDATTAESAASVTSVTSATSTATASPSSGTEASRSREGVDLEASFPSWNPASASLAAIVAFVEAATDEAGAQYVPPEDRVAVFDLDGTLISEKAPASMDYGVLFHRVLDDPAFTADEEMVELCTAAKSVIDAGGVDPGLGDAKGGLFARAFAGMTPSELRDLVNEYLDTHDAAGFSGMKCGDIAFRPMVEIVDFLKERGFEVYIVTGSNRDIARAFAESRLGIDPDHVIGSDWALASTGQNGVSTSEYVLGKNEELAYSGEQLGDCLNAEKVARIQREIGKSPILAFGNSTGDFSMLDFTQTNGAYPGMSVLIVDDDTDREYGNADHAAAMLAALSDHGWMGVSMRDDWSTIFGSGVEKTGF